MVIACDGVPKIVACPQSQGFKISPQQLEAAITDKTRWLIINSPSNPTGASYSAAEYRRLADLLARHRHVLVMTDDIYEHIRFEGHATPHLLNAAPEPADRLLAVNGVSKTYAMTGWRIGWIAGPSDLIGALNTLLSQAAGNACSISQAAAVEPLNGDQSFVTESVAIYRSRRDRMLTRINQIEGLSCLPPDGAFYLYVNCDGLIGRKTAAGAHPKMTATSRCICSKASASPWSKVAPMAYRRTSASRSQRRSMYSTTASTASLTLSPNSGSIQIESTSCQTPASKRISRLRKWIPR
ncbi:hypothetical protein AOQ72_12115 [Bradyrhizobium yuanmingense]|uniref:Aminotransferase n=1 Tax=Bradyrhizobium yuanmingense TaxID=108015 RepID=A0A0R3CQ55_9BRAD|nr:hypothetical protein AOQ72_12115 [Bradyrhizobium yuanmingense]